MRWLPLLFLLNVTPTLAQRAEAETVPLKIKTTKDGVLVQEGKRNVLFYQREHKSQSGAFRRANYIHPLYDLDGRELTEDFPADHPHHRGIFWAWHQMWVGDKKIGDPWVAKDFSWNVRKVEVLRVNEQAVALHLDVIWSSPLLTNQDGQEKPLVHEQTLIRIHRSENDRRMIDFRIQLTPKQNDVRIGGSEDDKGYGGFSPRIRMPSDIRFRGAGGVVEPQRTALEAGPWMSLTGTFTPDKPPSGVAILCHPTLPEFPQRWILRRSGSMQNVAYPGRKPVPLEADKPLTLRYRLVVHRGVVSGAVVAGWQREYAMLK